VRTEKKLQAVDSWCAWRTLQIGQQFQQFQQFQQVQNPVHLGVPRKSHYSSVLRFMRKA